MKDVIHSVHCIPYALDVSYVSYIVFYLGIVIEVAHVILLFFITAEYADLLNIGFKKPVQYGVSEGTCPAGYQ